MTARVIHGGVTAEELAQAAAAGTELVDLSASLNPYGPHPAVVEAARSAVLSRYPEADARTVREAYAKRHGLPLDYALTGNGSSELIYLVARAFGTGRCCLVLGPTFGEYAAAARAAKMPISELRWFDPHQPQPPLDTILSEVTRLRPSLVFLCNPDNPTGALVIQSVIEALTAAVVAVGGCLIVDEAYMDFAWPEDESATTAPGRLVLRSLTKLHAIPGLRAGFLLGEPGDIERVAEQQPPWSLSAPAAAAVLQALNEGDVERESRRNIASTRSQLLDALTATGALVHPSHANFVLMNTGDAREFRQKLLARGFVARDCTSFGLPHHVRIAVPHEDNLVSLVAAINTVLEEGK